MRSRILLISIMAAGILGTAAPAPAWNDFDRFNLERTVISGYIESVSDQQAYVLTDDGQEIGVLLGPQSYWDEHGFYLLEGDYVGMEVWYDPTEEYTEWYFAGEIWGEGFDYVLANEYGVPLWVLEQQDYYYGLGYRANCVSFMVWYDCPPMYFVYLILPPPPSRYYTCFYGPHWRNHRVNWWYGPRYGRGGSYWHDGDGYERPGRRGRNDNPGWQDPISPVLPMNPRPVRPRTPPRPEPQNVSLSPRPVTPPVKERLTQVPVEPRPRNDVRPVVTPRKDNQFQKRPAAPPKRDAYTTRPEVRPPKAQDRPVMMPRPKEPPRSAPPQIREPKAPRMDHARSIVTPKVEKPVKSPKSRDVSVSKSRSPEQQKKVRPWSR